MGRVLVEELGLPPDLVFVRKLHFPDNPEAGFGALSESGEVLLNPDLAAALPDEVVADVIEVERRALAERVRRLRKGPPVPLTGRVAILTDDGLASGYTMRAAVKEARRRGVVAVPTASEAAVARILPEVDALYVADLRTGSFCAVADAYQDRRDLSLEEVAVLLAAAQKEPLEQENQHPDHHQGIGEVEDRP